MSGSAVGKMEEVLLDELRDVVLVVPVFEFLDEGDEVGAFGEFLPDAEGILIGVVDGLELMHEVGLAIFGDLDDGMVLGGGVQHRLLLVPLDHPKSIYQYSVHRESVQDILRINQ